MSTRIAPELAAAMAEARELRALVAEICDTLAAQKYPARRLAPWRQRAGLDTGPHWQPVPERKD